MSLINRERINAIRQANDIPVRELANVGISRNRYYRYLNAENDLPAEAFITLMSHLLLTGYEINHELVNGEDTIEGLLLSLLAANQQGDAAKIKAISRRCYQLFRETMARGFLRTASLADVLHHQFEPNRHVQIAEQILIDSFESIVVWRVMDIMLIGPVITHMPVITAHHYLAQIWQKNWPNATMESLNMITVTYLNHVLQQPVIDNQIVADVTTWLTHEPNTTMSFAWWQKVVAALAKHEWDAAQQLIQTAEQLEMVTMAQLAGELLANWQAYVVQK